jgi:hypothetical protein
LNICPFLVLWHQCHFSSLHKTVKLYATSFINQPKFSAFILYLKPKWSTIRKPVSKMKVRSWVSYWSTSITFSHFSQW